MEIKSFRDLYHASPDDLKDIVRQQWQAKQNPEHHPEGNTLKHIIVVTNRAIRDYPDNINLIMAAYFHDLGKMETYNINPKTGKPTAYGHEKVSAALVNRFSGFIEEMGANPVVVEFIVANHMKMKPHTWDVMRQSKKDRIMDDPSFGDLEGLSKVDRGGLDEHMSDEELDDAGVVDADEIVDFSDKMKPGGVATDFIKEFISNHPLWKWEAPELPYERGASKMDVYYIKDKEIHSRNPKYTWRDNPEQYEGGGGGMPPNLEPKRIQIGGYDALLIYAKDIDRGLWDKIKGMFKDPEPIFDRGRVQTKLAKFIEDEIKEHGEIKWFKEFDKADFKMLSNVIYEMYMKKVDNEEVYTQHVKEPSERQQKQISKNWPQFTDKQGVERNYPYHGGYNPNTPKKVKITEHSEKNVEPNDIAVKAARAAYVDAWSEMPNIKGEMEEIERAAQDLNRDEKNYFKTSVKEIVKSFEGSEAQDLTKDIWDKLENTESNQPGLDMTDVYNISDMYNKSNPKKLMRKLVTGEYKYPLIVHFDDRYHLVAGNTRLSTAAALGITPKVFIGELNKDVPVDESIKKTLRKYIK